MKIDNIIKSSLTAICNGVFCTMDNKSLFVVLQIKDLLEEIKASKDEGYIGGKQMCIETMN